MIVKLRIAVFSISIALIAASSLEAQTERNSGNGREFQGDEANLRIVKDVVYAEREGFDPKLTSYDVYAPKEITGAPVMIFIHGGAWAIGDKRGVDKKVEYFTGLGFVFVTINYRLSPAIVHPEHIIDVAAAIAHVYKHAEDYGCDKEKLFVMGHSAGAHLAALISTDESRLAEHDLELGIIRGTILLDGAGYDIPERIARGNQVSVNMYQTAFTDDPLVWEDASPQIHAKEERDYPPHLIIHVANRAESREQSEALADALISSGGSAYVLPAAGKTHETVNRELGLENDVPTKALGEFLRCILGDEEFDVEPFVPEGMDDLEKIESIKQILLSMDLGPLETMRARALFLRGNTPASADALLESLRGILTQAHYRELIEKLENENG
ncbi:MAG: alpha/beta hydrolase [Planctomycetes bacterium]|nr:alpha/beta hydrolase [Planctomycetota bacterium]